MKRRSTKIWRAIVHFATGKRNAFIVASLLTCLAGYFPFKDICGFSISEQATRLFAPGLGDYVKVGGNLLVVYAALMQLVVIAAKIFGVARSENPEPERINHCVLKINNEIREHRKQIVTSPREIAATFQAYHHFEDNVGLVTGNMAEYVLKCFSSLKVESSDIFISIYKVRNFEDGRQHSPVLLEYVTSWHPSRSDRFSPAINLDDPAYAEYECVKAIRGSEKTVKKWDCATYAPSRSTRHKTITHYVGFRLEADGRTVGFLNVEFHNYIFFPTEDEMTKFIEQSLAAFFYFIEYQFLKKIFFATIHPYLSGTGDPK